MMCHMTADQPAQDEAKTGQRLEEAEEAVK